MDREDGIREAILSAADRRIARFGYGRTTVADIARDCGLSPARIYNFFSGKLDLAAAIERREDAALAVAMGREAHRHKGRYAAALRALLLREVRATHRRFSVKPGAVELTRRLADGRPGHDTEALERRRAVLAGLLASAGEAGEFTVRDPHHTAGAIQSATAKFRDPAVVASRDVGALVREAEGVVELILDGLKVC